MRWDNVSEHLSASNVGAKRLAGSVQTNRQFVSIAACSTRHKMQGNYITVNCPDNKHKGDGKTMAQSADTIAKTWSTRLGQSTQKITDGVNSVSVAPGQAAARQKTAYINNVQASADKWARNVAAVSLNQWQTDMVNKGIPRIATGAQAAESKMASFFTQLLPYIDTGLKALPARGTFEQNLNRMTAWAQHMHNFKRSNS